jgi:3-hydroxyisobutyrate dehydrogenase-like beta-hydroxyacid dehydrogenase
MATIAFLGPGDLATRLAGVLAASGHATITSLEGRGPRSRRICEERGLADAGTLAAALERADVVVSAVPPDQAVPAARAFAAALPAGRAPLYVDANSVAPDAGREVAAVIASTGAPFASATVHGAGPDLARAGQIFLSGPGAARMAAVVGDALRVAVLGDDPGSAKELKLLVAAMSKGLCALWMETGAGAARAGLLEEAEAALRHHYPAMMADLERMIPTYARHSERRTDEVAALAAFLKKTGTPPEMACATLAVIRRVADDLRDSPPSDGEPCTSRSLIRRLART